MITDEEFKEHGMSASCSFSGGSAVIELDSYRDDQAWRYFRLHRVVGYLRAVADSTGDYDLLRKISCIRDHKGTLFVFWHDLPNDAEKVALENAWDAECEDGEFIEHELKEILK